MMDALRGIFPPLVTPFTHDGDVDDEALRAEVRYALAAGVHGLVIGGSTGEGQALADDEVIRICGVAVEEVGGRVPVIGGIIRNTTREAVRLGRALAAVGVSVIVFVVPTIREERAGEGR